MLEPILHRSLATVLQQVRRRAFHAFARACDDPRATQARVLSELVAANGQTAHARRLGVTPSLNLSSFRDALPLTTYDDIAPEVEQAFQGAPDQLAPGHPIFFAMTSGTSGPRKLIPITEAYRQSFQRPMHLFLYGLQRDHPALMDRRVLYMVGNPVTEHSPAGIPVGVISGFNYLRMPPALQRFYAVPPAVFTIPDPEVNTWAVARCALEHDLSFAIGVTTWPFSALADTLARYGPDLIKDIERGTLTAPGPLPDEVRRELLSRLRPRPRRARALQARAQAADGFTPAALWPHLKLLSCWHHAAAGSALPVIQQAWRPPAMRSALYSATEGWLNVPLHDEDPSGVAAIDSVLFEFERLDSQGEGTGETVWADEVEVGGHYGIVMSTRVGIWRYRLGDEVKVTGHFARTPMFHFVQKAGAVLSVHHDLTTESAFSSAFNAILRRFPELAGARWWVWAEAPDARGRGHYRLLLSSPHAPATERLPEIATCFDGALREANLAYGDDRAAGGIAPARVRWASPAQVRTWERDRHTSVGAAGHQAKPVRLIKDPTTLPADLRHPFPDPEAS